MLVAITGTPGTGKSAVARKLRKRGFRVISVNRIAKKKFAKRYDSSRDTMEVDVDSMREYISNMDLPRGEVRRKNGKIVKRSIVFLEGHISHYMDVDMIIVLRASPSVIEKRLRGRGYSEKKIRENMEAEGVDVISIESKETGKEAFEIDTSEANVHKVADYIVKIVTGSKVERRKYMHEYALGSVNWSKEVLGWY